MNVGYMMLYSHREKADIIIIIIIIIIIEINDKQIHFLLITILLSGCHKYQNCKMYWGTNANTFAYLESNSMPHNMFERILSNLYLFENKQLDSLDNL